MSGDVDSPDAFVVEWILLDLARRRCHRRDRPGGPQLPRHLLSNRRIHNLERALAEALLKARLIKLVEPRVARLPAEVAS
eukprot:2241228-Prymnesium_polylepis.2